ncbi:hypothetical protein Vwe01_57970 [Micromonospora andamanensis]|nr:hypothetical protein Vwe01_57970 [Micromonospora andamanensis]
MGGVGRLVAYDFQSRARQMAVAATGSPSRLSVDLDLLSRRVGVAITAGVASYSLEGRAVLDRVVGPDLPAADRRRPTPPTAPPAAGRH